MVIGVMEVGVKIPGSFSLKDKRRVRQSLLSRLRSMGFSAAEVGDEESHNHLVLGLSFVSASEKVVEKKLDEALSLIAEMGEICELERESFR